MRINSNMTAITANRMLAERYEHMNKKMEKVNSGKRINSAGDDSAGLAISEKMKGQIRGYNKAVQNIQDGINMIDTAEGALNETHAILQRIRELAVRASSDTYLDSDRKLVQQEVAELLVEVDKIANETHYNTKNLLNGKYLQGFNYFVGPNKDDVYGIVIGNMDSQSLGIKALSLGTQKSANESIKILDDAIEKVGKERANIGASHNRLEYTLENMRIHHDNLTIANSKIRDADMAKEITGYTADKIMMQTGASVQRYANTTPQSVLQLIGA